MRLSTKAIIVKDIKTFFLNRQVLISVIILPLIFCVIYPALVSFFISSLSGDELIEFTESLGMSVDDSQSKEKLISQSYSILLMFITLIPTMLGSMFGGAIVAAEKESKTLETILYSPLTSKQFFSAKLKSSLIPGCGLTLISALLCIITIDSIAFVFTGHVIVPSALFLVGTLIFSPSILFFVLVLTLKSSSKSETSVQAQQKSVFFIIPTMLVSGFATGVGTASGDLIGCIILLVVSAAMILLGILLFNNIIKKMTPEKLIK